MATTKPAAKPQNTITVKQLAAELAEEHELSKKQVEALFSGLSGLIAKNLKKGNRIRWKEVGIMQVKRTSARTGRNPATGETIQIPAKKKVAFRVAKELKESVL